MKPALVILVTASCALGALLGTGAGPFLARANDTVALAARIKMEDATGTEERTLASDAFRQTGRPARELYADADRIEQTFRLGAGILGAFVGLAVSLRLFGVLRRRTNTIYDVDAGDCVSCARCLRACPREKLRLRQLEALKASSRKKEQPDAN
jgi:ferredoxin